MYKPNEQTKGCSKFSNWESRSSSGLHQPPYLCKLRIYNLHSILIFKEYCPAFTVLGTEGSGDRPDGLCGSCWPHGPYGYCGLVSPVDPMCLVWSWKVGFLKVYFKGGRSRCLKSPLSDFCMANGFRWIALALVVIMRCVGALWDFKVQKLWAF